MKLPFVVDQFILQCARTHGQCVHTELGAPAAPAPHGATCCIVEGHGVIGEQKIEHLTLSCILNMLS